MMFLVHELMVNCTSRTLLTMETEVKEGCVGPYVYRKYGSQEHFHLSPLRVPIPSRFLSFVNFGFRPR